MGNVGPSGGMKHLRLYGKMVNAMNCFGLARLKARWILLLSCCLVLASCEKSDPVEPDPNRAVLVYMAADNSLSSDGYSNIELMLEGMRHTSGRLLIYFDPLDDIPRLLTIQGGKDARIDTLREYQEENSASPEVLKRVVDDAQNAFPHSSYGLILWSHGMGWLPQNYYVPGTATSSLRNGRYLRTKYLGEDIHPGDGGGTAHLEIDQIARALPDGFDFILMDACFMSSVEALYELRNKAEYFISSPAEVIANGFPYDEIAPYLWGGEEDFRKICKTFFDFYNEHEDPHRMGWQSATVSLVKSAELEGLMAATRNILRQRTDFQGITAWSYPLSYSTLPDVFFDLGDYIGQVATAEQYAEFRKQLARTVIYKLATPEFFFQPIPEDKFSGLSTYIPYPQWAAMNQAYFGLSWPQSVYEK